MMRRYGEYILILLLCFGLIACGAVKEQNGEERQQPKEKESIRLEMAQETYPVTAERLNWEMINETGETYSVVLAPFLEQQMQDGSWQVTNCIAGFCGVGDPLPESLQSFIETAWYPDLQAGVYRLSYTVQLNETEQKTVSAVFTLTD